MSAIMLRAGPLMCAGADMRPFRAADHSDRPRPNRWWNPRVGAELRRRPRCAVPVISRRVRRQNAPQAWKMASGAGWETCTDAARDRDAMSGGAKSWLVRVPCTPLSTATPDAIKPCPRFPSHATGDSVLPPGGGVIVRERGCTTSQRLVGYGEGPCWRFP